MTDMTSEELFQEYEEAIAVIDRQANEAREQAKNTLREKLKALREAAHEELRAIYRIAQKVR